MSELNARLAREYWQTVAENIGYLVDAIEGEQDPDVLAAKHIVLNALQHIHQLAHLQPDWSKAPDWAQWWAMDASGIAYWYEEKPVAKEVYGAWDIFGDEWTVTPQRRFERDLSSVPDWQKTLQRRPQTEQENK